MKKYSWNQFFGLFGLNTWLKDISLLDKKEILTAIFNTKDIELVHLFIQIVLTPEERKNDNNWLIENLKSTFSNLKNDTDIDQFLEEKNLFDPAKKENFLEEMEKLFLEEKFEDIKYRLRCFFESPTIMTACQKRNNLIKFIDLLDKAPNSNNIFAEILPIFQEKLNTKASTKEEISELLVLYGNGSNSRSIFWNHTNKVSPCEKMLSAPIKDSNVIENNSTRSRRASISYPCPN